MTVTTTVQDMQISTIFAETQRQSDYDSNDSTCYRKYFELNHFQFSFIHLQVALKVKLLKALACHKKGVKQKNPTT